MRSTYDDALQDGRTTHELSQAEVDRLTMLNTALIELLQNADPDELPDGVDATKLDAHAELLARFSNTYSEEHGESLF